MTVNHHVVMAVVHRDQSVLLCHRSPDREWYPNVWDLPGGHVEPGEEPSAALHRELREELGISASVDPEPLAGATFGDVDALVWSVSKWSGTAINRAPQEHDTIAWFPLDELGDLELADPAIAKFCALAINAD